MFVVWSDESLAGGADVVVDGPFQGVSIVPITLFACRLSNDIARSGQAKMLLKMDAI